jgi:hypothetical protein
MFQGDEVAAVAADTEEHAIDAARLVKVEYEILPHVTVVEQALAGTAPPVFTQRQRAPGTDSGDRRSRGWFQGGRAHDRRNLFDARHHARLSRVAWHGMRVGGRQADGLDLDAGYQRRARELRDRAQLAAGQRPGDLPVHGGRLRRQGVERRRRGLDLRPARQGSQRAGQADARSQGGASSGRCVHRAIRRARSSPRS